MEQKAKRRKFGLLDVLIILVVIGVIVFAVKYSDNKSTSAGSGQGNNITFTVEIGKVESMYNAYVTIAAQAVIGESSTTVNNVSVMIGQELYPRSSDFAGSGYCVELDLEGGAQE